MKFTIAAIVLLIAYLLISKTGNALEENHYTLIKKLDNIEIRKYKDLIYTTYTPKNLADRNNSFRNVIRPYPGDKKHSSKGKQKRQKSRNEVRSLAGACCRSAPTA